ncbi:uncharacterized protein EV422DRAFT_613546 [Fimicolochytrium jonesii]|uniref:uncharacterized protein n=1 Tax=Fimicolochytrium jonesii TaxID=1396493 RepID=UPI0022FE9620|nr:uncharacterized protein EV422DRAFT_613546 [Fimicolochytrium jonesii]KAI8822444.1 hypothetical protein EV422DRAFT_613546 [Fimicolochytrium jonesii]
MPTNNATASSQRGAAIATNNVGPFAGARITELRVVVHETIDGYIHNRTAISTKMLTKHLGVLLPGAPRPQSRRRILLLLLRHRQLRLLVLVGLVLLSRWSLRLRQTLGLLGLVFLKVQRRVQRDLTKRQVLRAAEKARKVAKKDLERRDRKRSTKRVAWAPVIAVYAPPPPFTPHPTTTIPPTSTPATQLPITTDPTPPHLQPRQQQYAAADAPAAAVLDDRVAFFAGAGVWVSAGAADLGRSGSVSWRANHQALNGSGQWCCLFVLCFLESDAGLPTDAQIANRDGGVAKREVTKRQVLRAAERARKAMKKERDLENPQPRARGATPTRRVTPAPFRFATAPSGGTLGGFEGGGGGASKSGGHARQFPVAIPTTSNQPRTPRLRPLARVANKSEKTERRDAPQPSRPSAGEREQSVRRGEEGAGPGKDGMLRAVVVGGCGWAWVGEWLGVGEVVETVTFAKAPSQLAPSSKHERLIHQSVANQSVANQSVAMTTMGGLQESPESLKASETNALAHLIEGTMCYRRSLAVATLDPRSRDEKFAAVNFKHDGKKKDDS